MPKILYIDDESDLLDLAASFFEDENLPIETCTNFQDALSLIKANKYDLIISDARMPTGSGYELLKLIRAENLYDGKFIIVTGNIENVGVEEKLGCDLVLFKPLRFQELIEEVQKMLSL